MYFTPFLLESSPSSPSSPSYCVLCVIVIQETVDMAPLRSNPYLVPAFSQLLVTFHPLPPSEEGPYSYVGLVFCASVCLYPVCAWLTTSSLNISYSVCLTWQIWLPLPLWSHSTF